MRQASGATSTRIHAAGDGVTTDLITTDGTTFSGSVNGVAIGPTTRDGLPAAISAALAGAHLPHADHNRHDPTVIANEIQLLIQRLNDALAHCGDSAPGPTPDPQYDPHGPTPTLSANAFILAAGCMTCRNNCGGLEIGCIGLAVIASTGCGQFAAICAGVGILICIAGSYGCNVACDTDVRCCPVQCDGRCCAAGSCIAGMCCGSPCPGVAPTACCNAGDTCFLDTSRRPAAPQCCPTPAELMCPTTGCTPSASTLCRGTCCAAPSGTTLACAGGGCCEAAPVNHAGGAGGGMCCSGPVVGGSCCAAGTALCQAPGGLVGQGQCCANSAQCDPTRGTCCGTGTTFMSGQCCSVMCGTGTAAECCGPGGACDPATHTHCVYDCAGLACPFAGTCNLDVPGHTAGLTPACCDGAPDNVGAACAGAPGGYPDIPFNPGITVSTGCCGGGEVCPGNYNHTNYAGPPCCSASNTCPATFGFATQQCCQGARREMNGCSEFLCCGSGRAATRPWSAINAGTVGDCCCSSPGLTACPGMDHLLHCAVVAPGQACPSLTVARGSESCVVTH